MVTTEIVTGETVIKLADRVLVASKSEPGKWYEVVAGACDCKGYQYRGICRHVEAVKATETPICRVCGRPEALACLFHS